MEETKQPESAYSEEQLDIMGPDSLPNPPAAKESPAAEKTASKQLQTAQKVFAREISQSGAAGTKTVSAESPKRTNRVWLIAAGAIFGMVAVAVAAVVARKYERARNAGGKQQEQAILEVTPQNLTAWCGAPAEDLTKQMYPVVLRTMSYQRRENETIIFEFSRTAEKKSDWVLLSMKDQSGTESFETPEAKIAALPCLASMR
ncbi:MAG: hypothetical protein WBR26_21280 [Candidatus Acidiferrum sp.]